MPTEIICNVTGRETRVAVIENGSLVELHVDRGDNRGYVGNVYLGKVVRVLPGMQAAFVDIGLERAAFLYVGDIYPDLLDMHRRHPREEDDETEPLDIGVDRVIDAPDVEAIDRDLQEDEAPPRSKP